MRGARTLRVLGTLVTSLALLSLPVVRGIGDAPSSRTTSLAVDGWRDGADGWRYATADPGDAVLLATDLRRHGTVEVRAQRGGAWTPWQPLAPAGEHAPDPASREALGVRPGMSEPAWIGRAELLEVRTPRHDVGPVMLEAVTSEGGDGLAWQPPDPAAPGSADALSLWPPMVARTAWDPDGECQPTDTPDYAPSVERAYVHHTAIFPSYEPHESDDMVRAICRFHTGQRGFSDLGYNFLIDRYGTIFQGRAGGILRPVVGAHASGFNTGSVGIALIGDFETNPVPPAALASLDELLAWLFEWHDIDPYAVTTHVSTGGDTTPHPEGEHVALPTIVGHRQTGTNTTCPGELLFAHVNGADPASHRVAQRLLAKGIEVGEPRLPPAPQVVAPPTPPQAPVRADAPEVTRVLESVVAAVRTLTTRRLDQRLIPALGGFGAP